MFDFNIENKEMISNTISQSNTSVSNFSYKTQYVVSNTSFSLPRPLLIDLAKKITLKKSQMGIFSVMAYFIKFGFKEGCFIKQENYAVQLKKFGYKALRRQQVAIICSFLVEAGLVTRTRRHRRSPYEYQLTSLGLAYYEIKNPSYQKQAEPRRDDWPNEKKPYIEKDKNRTSQLRSSFNKTSYKNSWGKKMETTSFALNLTNAKSQEQLDKAKLNELRATEMAKEALAREGLQDPYKNPSAALKVDYDKSREYSSKLTSYTCYFRNQLSLN